MEIPFVLTRPNFVDIMSGNLLFEDEQEYKTWMSENITKFKICSNVDTKVLTLINF